MQLWIMNTDRESARIDAYLAQLTVAEQEKALRLRFEADRERSVLGATLIHRAFQEDFPNRDYALTVNAYGKPCYPAQLTEQRPAYFNLSHSGKLVVLAKGTCALGVDVEAIRSVDISRFARVFSEEEMASLQGSPTPDESFFTLWTRKEAFVKCLGKGLSALDEYAAKGEDFYYHTLRHEGHIITVCSERPGGAPEVTFF
ncbi:MAG: 4'-phosphopantetheinyl transferase superfamily protein [Eubacterium sp.]|nr:4'-phosphopantetheinyl transferase superfamily protein [Eubacterium sp.]